MPDKASVSVQIVADGPRLVKSCTVGTNLRERKQNNAFAASLQPAYLICEE